MEGCSLGFHIDLDDLLGVVPSAACVSHEDGLEETEDGDGDEVGDEEAHGVVAADGGGGGEAGEGEGEAEDGDEDVYHAALSVVGAYLDDFLRLGGVGFLGSVGVELDVLLDILHGTVGACGDSLHACAREPKDDAAAEDEAEDGVGVEEVEDGGGLDVEGLLNHEDEGENHGGGAYDGGAYEDGLGGCLEGVACSVVGFEVVLGFFEVGLESELALDLAGGLLDVVLDEGELIDALCVVGDGTVGIYRDGDGTHAQHAEGYETEGEYAIIDAEDGLDVEGGGGEVGYHHEDEEDETRPKAAHVACHETAEYVERSAALLGGFDHLFDVLGGGGGEEFGELGDERSAEGAAGDDDAQGEPQVGYEGVDRGGVEDEVGGEEGAADAEDGGNPHERGEGCLEVDVVGTVVFSLGDGAVDVVGEDGGDDAEDTHDENPHEEFHLHVEVGYGEEYEGDEGDARDAVGLETVGGGSDAVACIVACAVGDDPRIAGVILPNLEDHLHEVASDVGNLGEDAACDAEGGGAEALADGEAYEAAACKVLGHEHQDDEHQHEFYADEDYAYRHACTQGYVEEVEGFTPEGGESHAGVGVGVHTHPEPCHAVGAEDSHHGPRQDEHHAAERHVAEYAEIERYGCTDEEEEEDEELALLTEIGRAGLENHVADFQHRGVGFEFAHPQELPKAEDESQDDDGKAPIEDLCVGRGGKALRHCEVCFACKC